MTWRKLLKAHGLSSHLDAERLGAFIMGKPRSLFLAYLDSDMSEREERLFREGLQALKDGFPIQYLLHEAWFYGRPFYVDERVLIPRFDTEVLIEAALSWIKEKEPTSLLDLCTGSGAISITLKKECPNLDVSASDISSEALQVAKKNADLHQVDVRWREGDLFEPWKHNCFDIILSNPPYISFKDYAYLDKTVKKEPQLALCAADNGLFFYDHITRDAKNHLRWGGLLAVEIGANQENEVCGLFEERGYKKVECLYDAQSLPRVVIGIRD